MHIGFLSASVKPLSALVLYHILTVRVKRPALEGTLSTISDDHVTDALVTNCSGCSVTLKRWCSPWVFLLLIIDESSFQEAPPLIAAVSEQHTSCFPADLITQLETHVKVVDYPDDRSRRNDLFMTHKQAIALPGEPLGVTDRVKHHTDLMPGTRPIYVPSYRLPHSQHKVADELVTGLLDDGII